MSHHHLYFIIGVPLIGIAFLDVVLFYLLFKNNPQNRNLNKSIGLMCLITAAYAFFGGIVYIRGGLGLNYIFFYKCCWIGWLGMAPIYQFMYYIKDDKSKTALNIGVGLYVFWIIAFALCFIGNWMEPGAKTLIPYVPVYGILERPVRTIGGVMLLYAIYRLFIVRNEVSGIKKIQINYVILGLIIYAFGASVTSCFLSLVGGLGFDPALTSYFSLPLTLLIFYAITRYRLFDVQIIISNALSTIILTLVLGMINIAIFRALEPFIGYTWAIFISMFVTVIVFLRTPLRRMVQGGFSDTLLGDKYNYQTILRESTRAIVTILDQEELLNYLVHILQQSFKVRKVCLFLKHAEGPYYIRYQWGMGKIPPGLQFSDEKIIEWLKKSRQIFIKEEQQGMLTREKFDQLYDKLDVVEANLVLPLFFKDNLIGFLTLGPSEDDRPYAQSDIDILMTLTGQTAIAIENARLYTEAITDGLTGLYHHKYFMMRLSEELQRAQRYSRPLSLLLIDVDHFKNINDVCGHLAGDKVLVGVAEFIKKSHRTSDIVARYGGEEFAVILPDTDLQGALIPAKRLREAIEATPFEGNLVVTVSIGVAFLKPNDKQLKTEDFVAEVDKALYRAKENGRNRIEVAS
ncbi:MAG: diguanylate cyclase [Candidatus Omnitrophica bacterium]|nr:diguanylate cyclase [Candidatus Omnitrophota bacterium]